MACHRQSAQVIERSSSRRVESPADIPGSASGQHQHQHQIHFSFIRSGRARGRLSGIKMMNSDHTILSIITKHGKPSYPAPPAWLPDRTYYAYQPPPPPPVAPIEASRDTDWRDPTRPKREVSLEEQPEHEPEHQEDRLCNS
ncbi:hypothetical protein CCHR01_04149 [Colletotrichum chrysophilum]|uniref:Uncharacterized protein n=1 Tax=Colletotrichum chrysophilum TaxID=1836956 RepID=A0AAD9AWR8_9PEZI|nr:hypothetical protein CCHR01_04149 [Colletotrichum chrysophilum]